MFQAGVYRSPDLCRALLTYYRRAAAVNDWWAPDAEQYADALAEAMREAGISQEQ